MRPQLRSLIPLESPALTSKTRKPCLLTFLSSEAYPCLSQVLAIQHPFFIPAFKSVTYVTLENVPTPQQAARPAEPKTLNKIACSAPKSFAALLPSPETSPLKRKRLRSLNPRNERPSALLSPRQTPDRNLSLVPPHGSTFPLMFLTDPIEQAQPSPRTSESLRTDKVDPRRSTSQLL